MLNIPHLGQMHRNDFGRFHEPGRFRTNGDLNQERLLAEMLAHRQQQQQQQQQHGSSSGQHPVFGGMGGHAPPFLGRHPPPLLGGHGMGPMMRGFPRHGMPPPIGMGLLGSGMGTGMGTGNFPRHGMSPHMPIGLGMGMDLGISPGRPPFAHSPYIRPQHSSFGYHSPGPPRAHLFLPPQHRHAQSPFSRSRRAPFSSSRMSMFDDDDDDFEDEYRMMPPPRRNRGRHMRGEHRIAPRYAPRRRGYGLGIFEDSEDEFDECDDYFEEDDEYEIFGSKGSPFSRWRGGY